MLLGARVHLLDALATITPDVRHDGLRRSLEAVQSDLSRGRSLSAALGSHPQAFDPLYRQLVTVGEATGSLASVLLRLAQYLERAHATGRKLRGALLYPAFVLVVAGGVTAFMLAVVVPTFAVLFRDLGGTLPAPTRTLLAVSDALRESALGIAIVIAIAIVGSRRLLREEQMRARAEHVLLRLPLIGPLVRERLLARLTRTLGTLLASGVRLDEALDVARRSDPSPALGTVLKRLRQGVLRGEPLSRLLAPRAGEALPMPPLVASLLSVGEATAEVDAMLLYVAEHFEAELDQRMASVATLLEPILIVVVGVVLGGILIALYLPMFDLSTAI